nr:MAG TPA: hypothetical protein [Caudoviricetes sp.]
MSTLKLKIFLCYQKIFHKMRKYFRNILYNKHSFCTLSSIFVLTHHNISSSLFIEASKF